MGHNIKCANLGIIVVPKEERKKKGWKMYLKKF